MRKRGGLVFSDGTDCRWSDYFKPDVFYHSIPLYVMEKANIRDDTIISLYIEHHLLLVNNLLPSHVLEDWGSDTMDIFAFEEDIPELEKVYKEKTRK